jgi:hypothetical protein
MGNVQTVITFADLSEPQNLLVGTYEWRVWIDVDGDGGNGRQEGDSFDGSDVEILFTSSDISEYDLGSYEDPGTLHDFVSRTHKDASLYTWPSGVQTLEQTFFPNVLVDGNSFVVGSFAHWAPFTNLSSNFVVRVQVDTPSGHDDTPTGLTGNSSVSDPPGDAGGSDFADIVDVRALFYVP